MCPPWWVRYRKSIVRRQFCVLTILYIYDMRPAVIMSQFPPPPAPRRLTRPARALGDWRLIRLAAVSTKMGRNTPLLCVIVTVNTTLSGRGPATPSAQARRACGLCRLRPVPPACSITRGAFSNTSGATLTPQPALKIGTILIRNCSPFRGNFLGTDVGRLVICRLCGK